MRVALVVVVLLFTMVLGGGCAKAPAVAAPMPEGRNEPRAAPVPTSEPQVVRATEPTGARYASPYLNSGELAPWAARLAAGGALGALAGDVAGKASAKAINQVAGSVPYVGGLLAAGAKRAVEQKTEQAVLSTFKASLPADRWFSSPCELVNWMSGTHGQRADFAGAKVAVSTVYPEVGTAWDGCSR
jgi:hypothetical protein